MNYIHTFTLFGYSYNFNVTFLLGLCALCLVAAIFQRSWVRAMTTRHLKMLFVTNKPKLVKLEQGLMVVALLALIVLFPLEVVAAFILFYPVKERIDIDTLKGTADAHDWLRNKYLVNK